MSLQNLLLIITCVISVSCGNRNQNTKTKNTQTAKEAAPSPARPLVLLPEKEVAEQERIIERQRILNRAMGDNPTAEALYSALWTLHWDGDKIDDADQKTDQIKQKLHKLNGYDFGNSPYTKLNRIDSELSEIYNDLLDSYGSNAHEYILETFTSRLKFHLANPLTFNYKLSKLDSRISILQTPDKRYKFYSFNKCEQGYISWHTTYVQYKNNNGNMVAHQWDEDEGDYKDADGLLTKIWQFRHKETDYYVTQKGFKASLDRTLSIAIFTIADGKPIHHSEFYPEGTSQAVCNTRNNEHDISFDFNPQTLTISYTTYEDDYNSEGKRVKGSWKLALN